MKLVILGRDGVLNEPVDGGIRRPGDWRPIAGSLEAVAQMTQSGIRVCVVTHQPLLGSGEMGPRRSLRNPSAHAGGGQPVRRPL